MIKIYEKNKGKKAEYRGILGIICGYNNSLDLLVMRVKPNEDKNRTISLERIKSDKSVVFGKKNTRGYLYVTEEDIINK